MLDHVVYSGYVLKEQDINGQKVNMPWLKPYTNGKVAPIHFNHPDLLWLYEHALGKTITCELCYILRQYGSKTSHGSDTV